MTDRNDSRAKDVMALAGRLAGAVRAVATAGGKLALELRTSPVAPMVVR